MPKVPDIQSSAGGKKKRGTKGAEVCTVSGLSIHPDGRSTRGTVHAKPLSRRTPGISMSEVVARVAEDGTWRMTLVVSSQSGNYDFFVAGAHYIVTVPDVEHITFDALVEQHSVKPS